ncbi:MAG: septum formation initiator family protein [Bacteroidales bacterium]|nr:septum formation initiator family protein [Bacteroidales bacterium]
MRKFKEIWDRSKDGSRRQQRSFLRFAIVATGIFVLFMFVKTESVGRWIQAGFTLRSQERRIEALKADNSRLDAEIRAVTANTDSLERYAREQYGFAAPGDDVYVTE